MQEFDTRAFFKHFGKLFKANPDKLDYGEMKKYLAYPAFSANMTGAKKIEYKLMLDFLSYINTLEFDNYDWQYMAPTYYYFYEGLFYGTPTRFSDFKNSNQITIVTDSMRDFFSSTQITVQDLLTYEPKPQSIYTFIKTTTQAEQVKLGYDMSVEIRTKNSGLDAYKRFTIDPVYDNFFVCKAAGTKGSKLDYIENSLAFWLKVGTQWQSIVNGRKKGYNVFADTLKIDAGTGTAVQATIACSMQLKDGTFVKAESKKFIFGSLVKAASAYQYSFTVTPTSGSKPLENEVTFKATKYGVGTWGQNSYKCTFSVLIDKNVWTLSSETTLAKGVYEQKFLFPNLGNTNNYAYCSCVDQKGVTYKAGQVLFYQTKPASLTQTNADKYLNGMYAGAKDAKNVVTAQRLTLYLIVIA